MKLGKITILLVCIAIPVVMGISGAFATVSSIDYWYTLLAKPSFNPPNYLFGPVWILLYILMGFSLYIIWLAKPSQQKTMALRFFVIQMVLNCAWSFIFFYFRLIGPAMIEIVVLWGAIIGMIVFMYRTDRTAAFL